MVAQFPHSLLMHRIYYSKRAIIPKKIKLFAFPKREFAPPRKPVSDSEQETVEEARNCIVSLCGKRGRRHKGTLTLPHIGPSQPDFT